MKFYILLSLNQKGAKMALYSRIALVCSCSMCLPLCSMSENTDEKSPLLKALPRYEMNSVASFLSDNDFLMFALSTKPLFEVLTDQLIERKKLYEQEQFILGHLWTFKLSEIVEEDQSFDAFKKKADEYIRTHAQVGYGVNVDLAYGNLGKDQASRMLTYLLSAFEKQKIQVVKLDLTHNLLANLPPEIKLMPLLRELTFSSNPIIYKPGMFQGMDKLKSLDLSNTKLSIIPQGLFEGLARLSDLCLYSNGLTEVTYPALQALRSLVILNVRQNRLSSLDTDIMKKFHKLSAVDITGNPETFMQDLHKISLPNSFNLQACPTHVILEHSEKQGKS